VNIWNDVAAEVVEYIPEILLQFFKSLPLCLVVGVLLQPAYQHVPIFVVNELLGSTCGLLILRMDEVSSKRSPLYRRTVASVSMAGMAIYLILSPAKQSLHERPLIIPENKNSRKESDQYKTWNS